jgi:hypothetical protein
MKVIIEIIKLIMGVCFLLNFIYAQILLFKVFNGAELTSGQIAIMVHVFILSLFLILAVSFLKKI